MRLIGALALSLALTGLAHGFQTETDDATAAFINERSWAEPEGSCDDPGFAFDWAADEDGFIYQRDGAGPLKLDAITRSGDDIRTRGRIGLGYLDAIWRLSPDGSLRLWAETLTGDDGDVSRSVENGSRAGEATATMRACPRRAAFFPAETVAALDGAWAGGACAPGAGQVSFELTRGAPRIHWGLRGDAPRESRILFALLKEDAGWRAVAGDVTSVAAFVFHARSDGALIQETAFPGLEGVLRRCR